MIWDFRPIEERTARSLAEALSQSLKLGEFLAARGFSRSEQVLDFIRADLKSLPSPLSLSDMDKALDRLLRARRAHQPLAVCGDYDADGLTAASLLARGLRELGHEVKIHIPNRLTDGYGLKSQAVRHLAAAGVKLLITVDNGISDFQAVEEASRLGLDVIITDHHQLPPQLPPALAVIDPHRDELWRQAPPAGVGVAFLLLAAAKRRYREEKIIEEGQGPDLMAALALVAVGTIADLAPLTGPNRLLVRHGLSFLAQKPPPGLAALKKVCRLNGEHISARDIGFRLAPRLNAAGRLGSAQSALELLMSDDEERAAPLAAQLEEINRRRCEGQNRLCQEALERLELELPSWRRTVVLAGEGWPRGLLGLAASRVAERTGKPTILLSLEDGLATGSGRTVGSFNLYKALDEMRTLFISFGGHAQAAGLSLKAEFLPQFIESLEEVAAREPEESAEARLLVDFTASLADLDKLAKPLASLEPFGQDNPAPVAVVKRAQVVDARPTDLRGERHLKMILADGLQRRQVIGFNMAGREGQVERELDVALSLDLSEYRGQPVYSWHLLDFHPPEA